MDITNGCCTLQLALYLLVAFGMDVYWIMGFTLDAFRFEAQENYGGT